MKRGRRGDTKLDLSIAIDLFKDMLQGEGYCLYGDRSQIISTD
jgi:hypothetical protein